MQSHSFAVMRTSIWCAYDLGRTSVLFTITV